MKRVISLLLAIILVFFTVACGENQETVTDEITIKQREAAELAQFLLDEVPASRQLLIDHLVEYRGFSYLQAEYGVDSINADWYEQAAKSVQFHLDEMPYSKQTLIEILMEGGFSFDEAEYGATIARAGTPTVGQQNAAKEAQIRLERSPHSRKDLINRLVKYDGFTLEQAEYGVVSIKANWYEQAARLAQYLLNESPYSRQNLMKRLIDDDGFTLEQAEYGVDSINANWNEQANRKIEMLNTKSYSRQKLIDILVEEDGFTLEQAEHSVESIDVDWDERAAKEARGRLYFFPYSRHSLIETLVVEDGFTLEQAEFGVDSTKADWYEQAAKLVQFYFDEYPLIIELHSRKSLIDSLIETNGFTLGEAEHGVDSVNVDWFEIAAIRARQYLKVKDYSRQELLDELMEMGFSSDEAKYGANKAKKVQ